MSATVFECTHCLTVLLFMRVTQKCSQRYPCRQTVALSFDGLCHRCVLSAKLDSSGAAIGRRYARMDELGVPFGITIDFQTLEDDTVTLRERDSMMQVRMPLADVAPLMEDLVKETVTWKVRFTIPLLIACAVAHVGGMGEQGSADDLFCSLSSCWHAWYFIYP